MKFKYSRQHLTPSEERLQRFLEILPGMTSWIILLGMTALSLRRPAVAAILIIAFYTFWLFRLLYMTIFLALSYYRLKVEQKTNWIERITALDDVDRDIESLKTAGPAPDIHHWISDHIYKTELLTLKNSGDLPPPSQDIYHLVVYPVVKESREILEPGIKGLSTQEFPTKRMLVVFALEDRAREDIKISVRELETKYKDRFMDVLTVVHPSGLAGEARVKGANATYAAKAAAEFFRQKNIPLRNIIISCFDADTVVSPKYFSCLTYYFMVTPNRIQSSFQPIPVYHNNIWEVPGFARVIESGSSFFQLIEATNPEKLVTFSSHSMSFEALVDVGYWPVDMISDDSAIYWKSLIHYDGNYNVVPMYVTLSMDIAGSDKFFETVRSVYKQKRRWAWGVENFPIVIRAFLKADRIPLYDKFRHSFKLFEGHISWATWGFLLSFIGWLPAWMARQEFMNSVVYYNAPRITGTIFQLALISLFVSIFFSIGLLPKRKSRDALRKRIGYALEWLMMPFILIIFSALPALDAQTRLMLGRRMEFWVTDKSRKK